MYLWSSAEKEGISRLLVGGLHRGESRITEPILRALEECEIEEGSVVLADLGGTTDLSTLDERFLSTEEGRTLISLIERVRPSLYVELHTYVPSSYGRLTSPHRMDIEGVPPLIELERGILHASTSPLLRRVFRRDDLCLLLEVPEGSEDVAIELLRGAIDSSTREEYVGFLQRRYPQQISAGMRLFESFYHDRFEYP
ncbi:DUF2119 family protein [Methermicoccus shengliensis]|uniref:DUF2119 family protein n=1 Tax=Methermicoccus shengliensis TaxID=660064 RepID=A0A832RY53_9EURY|nr:DUF2119 family protein [Methermicoccus shengliensis]KUK04217.1 MAG: hypothetical protein XD46_1080 [Euryarchaeota archaeon 55_53]KUK29946.1 MAG: hypothetical protein XD62_0949 [Methanosarcinales archeaon 56_1174]MDI3488000.1 hypothetical protein [Methanosarcinales archaeon]MDN5295596.1 hypothetical protein [Methanosarcinales archaeon]HIH70388.1 DUF2119 family protein [Methermicoccus shengliensis]